MMVGILSHVLHHLHSLNIVGYLLFCKYDVGSLTFDQKGKNRILILFHFVCMGAMLFCFWGHPRCEQVSIFRAAPWIIALSTVLEQQRQHLNSLQLSSILSVMHLAICSPSSIILRHCNYFLSSVPTTTLRRDFLPHLPLFLLNLFLHVLIEPLLRLTLLLRS